MSRFLSLTAALLGLPLTLVPAAEHPGLEQWTVTGPASLLPGPAGSLGLRYESPAFEKVVIRPPEAVPLPSGTAQVRCWCARMEGDFDLRFLIRDAGGAEHGADTLTSRPQFPSIRRSSMRDWYVWRQVESIHLLATGPLERHVQPEYLPLAQKLDWPQPLALTGVEIIPARNRRDNEAFPEADAIRAGKGSLWLAGLGSGSSDGLQAPENWFLEGRWRWGRDARPRLFPDDLTRRSGPFRYALELRKGYQGPLVWRRQADALLDRDRPLSILSDCIELPALPPGRYFLESRTWRPSGELERREVLEYYVIAGQARDLPAVAAPMTWETGQPHHVYPSSTTFARLILRCDPGAWPGRPQPATCWLRVTDWRGRVLCESPQERGEQVALDCQGLREGTDYLATAEFRDGTKVLDRTQLHFGVASLPKKGGSAPSPDIPGRDSLLQSRQPAPIGELYGSLFGAVDPGQAPSPASLERADRWLKSLPGLGLSLGSFMFGWGECEPLPGVFRWDEIEQRLALAQSLGVRMFLTPTLWGDPLEWPRWIEFQPMLDSFGYVLRPGQAAVAEPALADPIRAQGMDHWLRAVATRFLDHPTVIGYRTKPVNLHGDNKPQPSRPDFAPVTQQAFRQWRASLDPADSPPPAVFVLPGQNMTRTGPDLSPGWQRFVEFRVQAYTDSVRGIVAAIRSVDPVRQIHVYRSSTPTACEAAIPLLADGAEFHDEGGPFYFQRAVESMCLQAGIPYTNEGHQFTPPSLAMIDAGFFYGSTFDRGWSWLYRWHDTRQEDPRFAALPRALEFARDSQPALREWVAAQGEEPQVLVFGSRADRVLGNMRTGFYSDIAGLDVFAALFAYHQLRAHFADEHTSWVDLKRFRCVFAAGEVMPASAIGRLEQFARAGGKLVLAGEAGRFCPERPAERHLLRRSVEGLANVRLLAAPAAEPPAPGAAFRASPAFPREELQSLLAWADVTRSVTAETPGFECIRKQSPQDGRVYVAVFRRFPGDYDAIWYDSALQERWGRQAARILLTGLSPGAWRVEQFHRQPRLLGQIQAGPDKASFETSPATVGELQLFRLVRLE